MSIKQALLYVSLGWKVVPIWGIGPDGRCLCGRDCKGSSGKHPIYTDWGNKTLADEDAVLAAFDHYPGMNVGILLGPESGLIDIEFDTEEGAATADALLDGVITPTFNSNKSTHRLFKYDPDLVTDKGVMHWRGLEIRTGAPNTAIQSVFPPSQHYSGAVYQWRQGLDPESCEPVDLPDEVIAQFVNNPEGVISANKPSVASRIKQNFLEGERNERVFETACKMAAQAGTRCNNPAEYDFIQESCMALNSYKCKPPLPVSEIEGIVRSAVSMEMKNTQSKLVNKDAQETTRTANLWGLHWDRPTGEFFPGDWSLEIVKGDPTSYLLKVPAWEHLCDGGVISVDAETFHSPDKMAKAILASTRQIVVDYAPGKWPAIWNGVQIKVGDTKTQHTGLKAKLAMAAKLTDAAPVDKKAMVVSEYVLGKLNLAKRPPDGSDEPRPGDQNGTLRDDGSVWFVWSRFFEDGILSKQFNVGDLKQWRRVVLGIEEKQNFVRHPNANGNGRTQYFVVNRTLKEKVESYLDGANQQISEQNGN